MGSAEDETYDQLLESVLVGPVNVGNYRFVFQVIMLTPCTEFSSLFYISNMDVKLNPLSAFLCVFYAPGRQTLQIHQKYVMKISLVSQYCC